MAIELTTVPSDTPVLTDVLYWNDVSETPDAINQCTVEAMRTAMFLSGAIDGGALDSFEIPNSAAPTVNANGEIAVDTTITDMSHGLIKYYSGEECAVIAVPVGELTGMTNGDVVKYNATNDEFEIGAGGSGIGGSTGATDNAVLRADGTGGSTAQNSLVTIDDNGTISLPIDQSININAVKALSYSSASGYVGVNEGLAAGTTRIYGSNVFLGTSLATYVSGAGQIVMANIAAPSSASDTGTAGMIRWASGFIYICTATNTWQRAAIATW